uniref:Uncharacterized protein n=1 Tax=Oryza sativa subsp. japonica TaxID=39947 RepID=Q69XT5_ORYSJ|nr:hypothetical protein [Oryza sativa Japonica Group]
MAMVAATMTTTATAATVAATTTSVGASAQELYAVTAASESATRSTGPAMVAPECQPKNVTTGMRASGLQDQVALVSIGGWTPNQGVLQPAIIVNPSFSRHRRGLCPGRPYWAASMQLSNRTLSTELKPMELSTTEQGNRQVQLRGKSMGTAIDSEPTAIDLFKELHCSKTKGFSEPVKKAIEDMHAQEILTSPSVEDGQQAKTSIEDVSKLAAKTTNVMKEIQVELDAKKLESAVLQEELERLKAQALENYRHCINDDVLWWSQKLVSDSPSVMTTILSLRAWRGGKLSGIVFFSKRRRMPHVRRNAYKDRERGREGGKAGW